MKKSIVGILGLLGASYGTFSIAAPLGDGKTTLEPKTGYVYSCQPKFNASPAPAPWISLQSWQARAKPMVSGNVDWASAQFKISVANNKRVITGNGLPKHNTGVFPINTSDTAFLYDSTAKAITAQNLSLNVPANPQVATAPYCVDIGIVGFALSGSPIYSALNDSGEDALAHEVLDRCGGHPDAQGQYHYHGMSVCFRDNAGKQGKHSDLVGYALDGFGIYGTKGENGKVLSNNDLDACHGHTHSINWNGKTVALYHYHLTDTFPYSIGCFKGTPITTPNKFILPAEFEEQNAVWLFLPLVEHRKDTHNFDVTLGIMRALKDYVPIKLLVPDAIVEDEAKKVIPLELQDPKNLTFIQLPYLDFWARDMGPVFLRNSKGKLAMADFYFNYWGYDFWPIQDIKIDEAVDRLIANAMNLPIISSKLESEGGDRESNGKGTLLLVEAVELQRNPGKTLAQIEAEQKRVLGTTNIIWLKEGIYEDEHTFDGPLKGPNNTPVYTSFAVNGHVDEFARFADANTIVLAQVDTEEKNTFIGQENARRLEVNYNILKNAKDQDGKPFKIIRLSLNKPIIAPMTPGDPIYDTIKSFTYLDGSTFPIGQPVQTIAAASYMNFLITNGVVLGQKFYQEGSGDLRMKALDDKAKATLQQAFPGRDVILIDAMAMNWGGGGIHCITAQEPKH